MEQPQTSVNEAPGLHQERLFFRCFDVFFAASILLISLPFFIIVPILIKLHDRGPVFYSGARLGQGKSTFIMYKFRTLIVNAESMVGSKLVSTSQLNLETAFGRFLRDTRIDELPQLINVLKGDMALIGPRPERQLVYNEVCRSIPGYDLRFAVKPGVIGYSQLFTPHNTQKEIRTLIDNIFIRRSRTASDDAQLLFYALTILGVKLIQKSINYVGGKILKWFFGRTLSLTSKSLFNRPDNRHSYVEIWYQSQVEPDISPADVKGKIVLLNGRDVHVSFEQPLTAPIQQLRLVTRYKILFERQSRYKSVRAKVVLKASPVEGEDGRYHYVLSMVEMTPLNVYKLSKYFLSLSIS